jgi:hypothetical protein
LGREPVPEVGAVVKEVVPRTGFPTSKGFLLSCPGGADGAEPLALSHPDRVEDYFLWRTDGKSVLQKVLIF